MCIRTLTSILLIFKLWTSLNSLIPINRVSTVNCFFKTQRVWITFWIKNCVLNERNSDDKGEQYYIEIKNNDLNNMNRILNRRGVCCEDHSAQVGGGTLFHYIRL